MANINTSTRPFDDDLEEFEVRIRVRPKRNPSIDPITGDPRTPQALAARYEVEMRGLVEDDRDPEKRTKAKVGHVPLTDESFSVPSWTPGDSAAVVAFMAKFHDYFAGEVV